MAKPTRKRLESGDVASRLGDCRGAVKLAIEAILSTDADQIDAALGSLCLVERELQLLNEQIDLAEMAAKTGKASEAVSVN